MAFLYTTLGFLEWIGAPESARLLELGPDRWIHSLSREQAIDAACQLHRDVCLMTTNLGPWVRRAAIHMEAMGLWPPSVDPATYR